MADKEQPLNQLGKENYIVQQHTHLKTTLSTELTIATQKEEVILPPQYANYTDVFSERTFDAIPP